MKSLRLVALVASSLALLTGCAQDLEEINRVQPNYVKKSDIVGREYYLRTTVVGTQFTSAYAFPGSMSSTVRGVFEVQEGALLFFRTYEFIHGSEQFAQKSDADVPMLDKDGKVIKHAVLQDYARVACASDAECTTGAWCANGASPKASDEALHHGFCVQEATRYIYRGAPVMAYPITSHFDITNNYSAASGEKSNVQVENTSDRQWFEREYMRVAWGGGQTMSYEADVVAGMLGSGANAPSIYEGDNAPEGEKFEMGSDTRYGKDVPQKYITFLNRYVLAAPSTYLQGFGAIPICFFYPWYTGGVYDCITEEVDVRTFFLEVPNFASTKDPERAYVGRDLDDVEMEKFGFFRSERRTYDVQFTHSFSDAMRRAQRHRIWDRYVKKMEKGADGVERWTGAFDYTTMEPVPLVYYLNKEHPRELVEASKSIAAAWSEPLSEVVAFWKGNCSSATDKASYDKCITDNKPAHPMFILCENNDAIAKAADAAKAPVAEWSGTEIGKKFCRGMNKDRIFGDLRYSMMHAVTDPIQIGLYGYGPSAADPMTGEIMAGYAHSYVAQMKLGAERAMRTVEYHAGVIDFNDVKRNTEQQFTTKGKALKHYGRKGPKTTKEAIDYVQTMIDPAVRKRFLAGEGLRKVDNAGTFAQGRMAILRSNPTLDAKLVAGDDGHSIHALFKDPRVAKGTPTAVDAEQLDQMSLAQWNHIAGLRARESVKLGLAEKNIMLAEFLDSAILGLANEYGRTFDEAFCKAYAGGDTATIYDEAYWTAAADRLAADKKGACTAAGDFESIAPGQGRVCASFGGGTSWAACESSSLMQALRIAVNDVNGGSPFAEQNEFLPSPLYSDSVDSLVRATQEIGRDIHQSVRKAIKVELWSRIYEGTQLHEVGHTVGLRHNFEASTDAVNFDPEFWALKTDANGNVVNPWQRDTDAQALGHIREHMLASVMDYTSKFNGRFGGLGLYDKAAIKFGYGDMVEVFNKAPDLNKSPDGKLPELAKFLTEPSDSTPGFVALNHLGNQDMLKLTRKVHYSTLPKYFGSAQNLYDRRVVAWNSIKGKRCEADTDCGQAGIECRPLGAEKFCTDPKLTEVPYRFCSDEYNGRTPTCASFDEGADALEIARNSLDDYENYWFFYGYGNDSVMYHPNRYSGTVTRYLYTAVKQFQYWAMDFNYYQTGGWWKQTFGTDFDVDPNGGLSGALATAETFNVLAQVLARPSPSYYCYNASRGRYEPYDDREQGSQSDCQLFNENEGARPLYAGWDFAGYDGRPVSGGQFYDRLAAFALLTDPTPPNYVNHIENEDIRRYLVSFYHLFPKKLMNVMSAISVEDPDYYGWCVINGGEDGDYIMRRHYVGGDGKACLDACDPEKPLEQQGACRKYWLFPDGRPTFPSSRFRMPLLGALYGMALLTDAYDRSYTDVARLFLQGHSTQIDLPNDVTKCTFTDPLSGKIYVAPMVNDAGILSPGCMNLNAAQEVLSQFKDLQTLQDNYLFSEYQFRVSLIEVIRALHQTYEY